MGTTKTSTLGRKKLRREGIILAALMALVSCGTAKAPATQYRVFGSGVRRVVDVTLDAVETVQEIAAGVRYQVWTFGGTAPGPVIRVHAGDLVHFTLNNKSTMGMAHSIDFHAAQTPWDVNYKPVAPGHSLTFDWTARFPGVFMYHCGVPPVLHHISNGMYGAIIVEPNSLPAAREYVLVSSEYYVALGPGGLHIGDPQAMLAAKPTYVVWNGRAGQYMDHPLEAKPNELIRLWVMNAGPTLTTAFHVIGAVFDHVYESGNPTNAMNGVQTWNVAPGGGAMFELTIPDQGLYPFVTHSFAYTGLGAVGVIKISNDAPEAPSSYPTLGDPFTGGLLEQSGLWTGKPPPIAFGLGKPMAQGPGEITAQNIKFDPTALTLASGSKLTLVNKDALAHNFTIDALNLKVDLPANATATISFDKPPGKYEYYCSIPGHRQAGMSGFITVTAAGAH